MIATVTIQFASFRDIQEGILAPSTESSLAVVDDDVEGFATEKVSRKNTNEDAGFDKITATMYQVATSLSSNQTRKEFILDSTWKRGTGGLDDEDRKLLGQLYHNASSIFEFGLGESTLIAAETNVPRYAGIDSDANWVTSIRESIPHREHFRFYFADIGKTKKWGYPESSLTKNVYDYQIVPLEAEKEAFDVYLVDGRYRVACLCLSLLHAMKHGADMEHVKVGIHDAYRREYQVVKQIGDLILETKNLRIFQLKNGVVEDDIVQLWQQYLANEKR